MVAPPDNPHHLHPGDAVELRGYPLGACCCVGPTTCLLRFDCPCERLYDIFCRCYCARCYVGLCCGPEYKDCKCAVSCCPKHCCELPHSPSLVPKCQCAPKCQGPKCCANYGCQCCCCHCTCFNVPVCCTPCLCGRCHEERLDLKTGKYVTDEPGAPLVAPVAEVVARDKEPDIPEAEASVVETAPPEPPAATPSMLLCCDAPKVDLPSRAALAVVCA